MIFTARDQAMLPQMPGSREFKLLLDKILTLWEFICLIQGPTRCTFLCILYSSLFLARSTTAAYSNRCVYLWKAEVIIASSCVELYFA
jgi:hypothetical protein